MELRSIPVLYAKLLKLYFRLVQERSIQIEFFDIVFMFHSVAILQFVPF